MTRSWSLLIAPREDGLSTKTNLPDGLEVVPVGGEGRGLLANGREGDPCVSVFLPPAPDQKLYALSSSRFWPQQRPSRQWRTDQSVQRYEKSAHLAADYVARDKTDKLGTPW